MPLPARPLAALCVAAGLLLAGCGAEPGNQSGTTPAPASSPAGTATAPATAPASGGTCDATVREPSAPATPDAEASTEALAGVEVGGDPAQAPAIRFTAPLAIGTEVARLVADGDGDRVTAGQLITFNYVVCDIVTGQKMHSTWGATSGTDAPETCRVSVENFGETLTSAFTDARVGARLLWAQPGTPAEESTTGEAVNGFLYAITILGARPVLDAATGEPVTPTDPTLPVVTFADGKPTVAVPDSFEDPRELVVQPLIAGAGPTVEQGQTVLVKYTGWLTDGTQFDSSWDRSAPDDVLSFQVGLGGVIEGWDTGIVGQRVGSRLLLVIPSDMAYGAEGSGDAIPGDSTLIFVVDILAAY